jgi:hypothetical protein
MYIRVQYEKRQISIFDAHLLFVVNRVCELGGLLRGYVRASGRGEGASLAIVFTGAVFA